MMAERQTVERWPGRDLAESARSRARSRRSRSGTSLRRGCAIGGCGLLERADRADGPHRSRRIVVAFCAQFVNSRGARNSAASDRRPGCRRLRCGSPLPARRATARERLDRYSGEVGDGRIRPAGGRDPSEPERLSAANRASFFPPARPFHGETLMHHRGNRAQVAIADAVDVRPLMYTARARARAA